ncbi:HTH_Tnp_Tc3_2 domain-containing protein [Trichonephila clavipes]|nr:HTH_Tnp_Tc3_2 domain-containing protein [Trichonephila clavipes]
MPIEAFNQFRSYVATEIRDLDFSVENEIMYKDLKSSIENIQNDFVITYVDKVSANYAIICKYFYSRLESGQTQRSVADAVGVARSVVAKLWNRFQETGNVRRRPEAGRPRATTSTNHRYMQLTARRNRTENATQMQRQLLLATGRRVFSQTVRNRLHEGRLCARRPMVCIPLTPRHRAARRRWAPEHRDSEQHDWSQVLFTDESRFSLECDTQRVLVWRDRGTRNNPAFVRERSQYRRAGGWYGVESV